MLVFGGDSDAGANNDVWELTLTGTPAWTKLATAGTPPVARYAHSAIYDPVRDRLLVFGGNGGGYRNDVWELSLSGTPTWAQLTPTGTPPVERAGHTAIYDPLRDRMLIFGGYKSSSYWSDVWELSLSGTPAWTQLFPSGSLPGGSAYHSAFYDPVRDRMVVFGGRGPLSYRYNDVHALKLSGTPLWTLVTPIGTPPSERYGHAAIYDAVRDRMVVFGGNAGGYPQNDTWALALASPAWTQLAPGGSTPSPRANHTAIYDVPADRMVVYGGGGDNIAYELPMGSLTWATYGPGSEFPVGHSRHSAVYDAAGQRMVVFGGFTHIYTLLNETWTLSLGGTPVWTQLLPSGTPPSARSGHSAVYDPLRNRMVIFGGYDNPFTRNDVWQLTLGGTPAWTHLFPAGTPPSNRSHHSAVYDPVRDRMIVFGGDSGGGLNDVWELALSGTPTWSHLIPSGTPPSVRSGHTAIYDPVRDRMLVFGGYSAPDYLNDVWELALAGTPTWTQLAPSGTPPGPRHLHAAIYDPQRDRMVVFAGYELDPIGYKILYHDTWALSLASGPQWDELSPGGTIPDQRRAPTAIYDRIGDRMVMYGGEAGSLDYIALGDLWGLEWGNPVVGPDIEVAPLMVDYGQVFVGETPSRVVVVSNYGTSNLTVSDIASSEGMLTPDATSFVLTPAESRFVNVQWAPTGSGALNATLTISSDDPDTPSRVVMVTGEASSAPSFTVDPESLHVTLDPDAMDTRTLRVENVGGADFVFTAEAIDSVPPGAVLHGRISGLLRAGGPDDFGYSYRDSDEPGGPVYDWVEVSGVGTQIAMNGDDQNYGPYPIGFDFPYYDGSFSSFRICTNGWISFTNGSLTSYTNTSLPSAGVLVPENLLAVMWDDLDFTGSPRAYYHSDGSRLVIQYQDVERVEEPGQANTFEAILYPDGTIVYQYATLNSPTLSSCTVGIQNATRDDGLQVVLDDAYLHEELAIRFHGPLSQFLSVSPVGGTVPPQAHLDLTLTFDATGLAPGEYLGVVRIDGNDPLVPRRDVPCRLTVQGPVAVPGVAAVERFGLRFAGANPARGGARFELALPGRARVTVSVYDVRGALVRRLAEGAFEPGRHAIPWDGADQDGRRTPAGVYFVQAVAPSGRIVLRLAWLR